MKKWSRKSRNLKTGSRACSIVKPLLLAGLLISGQPLPAAEISDVAVSHHDDLYEVHFKAILDAPADRTYCLLTDFTNLHRISQAITKAEWLQRENNIHLVKIYSEGCVMFYCRRLQQTQRVTEMGDGFLLVEDVEAHSDFAYASALWQITPHEKGTQVVYRAVYQPDFWMPPVMGPWLFQDALDEQSRTLISNLEKLANGKI